MVYHSNNLKVIISNTPPPKKKTSCFKAQPCPDPNIAMLGHHTDLEVHIPEVPSGHRRKSAGHRNWKMWSKDLLFASKMDDLNL